MDTTICQCVDTKKYQERMVKGRDMVVEYLQNNKSHSIMIHMQYGLSRCTNTKDTQTAAIGRQLLYVPIHKASVTAGFTKTMACDGYCILSG